MNIYDAILYLNKEENVLNDIFGNRYQRYDKNFINILYSKDSKEYEEGSISSSISNMAFIKENIDNKFIKNLQFYQKEMKFPLLCKVKTSEFQNYKIVCLKSYSTNMFNTGFGESYIPNIKTELIPLTNEEIEKFKN
jgi:hypothetical protein